VVRLKGTKVDEAKKLVSASRRNWKDMSTYWLSLLLWVSIET
jgi:hypothetical protein